MHSVCEMPAIRIIGEPHGRPGSSRRLNTWKTKKYRSTEELYKEKKAAISKWELSISIREAIAKINPLQIFMLVYHCSITRAEDALPKENYQNYN